MNSAVVAPIVTGAVGVDHQPVQEREDLIEAREAVQVGVVVAHVAAVAVPDVVRHQGQTGLFVLRDAVPVLIEEDAAVEVGTPLRDGDLKRRVGGADGVLVDADRGGQTVNQEVVLLVKDGDPQIPVRHAGKGEVAVRVALSKGEVRAVRGAQAHVAL